MIRLLKKIAFVLTVGFVIISLVWLMKVIFMAFTLIIYSIFILIILGIVVLLIEYLMKKMDGYD